MANENRIYTNLQSGSIIASINSTATSIVSNQFAGLPTIDNTNHLMLTIDDEIIMVTNHPSSSNTITVARNQEGTAAASHNINAIWTHSLVASDLMPASSQLISASQTLSRQWGNYLVNASSGPLTITLTSPIIDMNINIKKSDSSANAITVQGYSGQTIDGSTTLEIIHQYDSYSIISDGTNYFII